MAWHTGLTFRSMKAIKTKGDLFRRCMASYKSKTKDLVQQRDLAELTCLTPARVSSFFAGQWEDIPDGILDSFLNRIKLPKQEFLSFAKNTAIPKLGMYAADFLSPKSIAPIAQTEPPSRRMAVPTESAIKPQPTLAGLVIESHLEEGLLAVVGEGTIRLFHNSNAAMKQIKNIKGAKWKYIAPADIVADQVMPRKSKL